MALPKFYLEPRKSKNGLQSINMFYSIYGSRLQYYTGYKIDPKYYRTVNSKGEKIDIKNPDPSLRSRPAVGLEILRNFTYAGDGEWEDGTVYDPKSGRTYSCKMSMSDPDKLNIRGYVGFSMLGRTESWTRAK